jgi:glucose-1-phosphate thymidylyltransferase
MGYISKEKLLELATPLSKNQYGQYLIKRANQKRI